MQGNFWLINSPDQIAERTTNLARHLRENWTGPVAIQPKPYKKGRSLDQNALYQRWARQYASYLLHKSDADVTEEEHEAMKITLQRHCYADTGWDFLITHQVDLFTGESKPARQKTSRLNTSEMSGFMEWVQAKAANDGLILESLGEYAELMR